MLISGLGTASTYAPTAGNYELTCTLSTPTISEGATANSQVVTVVNKNGSPIYTSNPGARGFQLALTLAANDLIAVTTSSSTPVDQGFNVIKCSAALG